VCFLKAEGRGGTAPFCRGNGDLAEGLRPPFSRTSLSPTEIGCPLDSLEPVKNEVAASADRGWIIPLR
jgi:hypothetical protein